MSAYQGSRRVILVYRKKVISHICSILCMYTFPSPPLSPLLLSLPLSLSFSFSLPHTHIHKINIKSKSLHREGVRGKLSKDGLLIDSLSPNHSPRGSAFRNTIHKGRCLLSRTAHGSGTRPFATTLISYIIGVGPVSIWFGWIT